MPTVSICIPTYEPNPEHLREALESVICQKFMDWELIIHDDASKTNVEEIVHPFLNDRISFHHSTKRLGIGGNWNACARNASGELIAYLFQDDLWHPHYLEHSVNILQNYPDIGFTAAEHEYQIEGPAASAATGIYEEVQEARNATMCEGRIDRQDFLTHWIAMGLRPNLIGEPSFVVFRRELMKSIGTFREDLKQGLDAEYWIRCFLRSDGFWIAENLGTFRVHAAGASARNEESGAGSLDRLRVFRSLIKALPAGETKRLAKKVLRREVVRMAKKFIKRR